jgi:transcriptional regulator with XRE-family HTH domain
MDLTDRLNVAISHAGIKRIQLATQMGVNPSTITSWKQGRHPIGIHAQKMANILEVPEEWLINGTGPIPEWLGKIEDTSQFRQPLPQKEILTLLKKLNEDMEQIKKNTDAILARVSE